MIIERDTSYWTQSPSPGQPGSQPPAPGAASGFEIGISGKADVSPRTIPSISPSPYEMRERAGGDGALAAAVVLCWPVEHLLEVFLPPRSSSSMSSNSKMWIIPVSFQLKGSSPRFRVVTSFDISFVSSLSTIPFLEQNVNISSFLAVCEQWLGRYFGTEIRSFDSHLLFVPKRAELNGYCLLDAARQSDFSNAKKFLSPSSVRFLHPETGDTALGKFFGRNQEGNFCIPARMWVLPLHGASEKACRSNEVGMPTFNVVHAPAKMSALEGWNRRVPKCL
ncbi:unnamed protein product [Cyprideis torosa]|uniref:Uncharacterized protein n=1 Tax=Cyprideis torosa TaxID=163714 RepID=A0A7R8WFK8_9CRUS|nr:unnamed protein product [Cyprideis torosa]CAG0897000.1 unnamed protein product [Cyprideis torosa]